MRQSRQPIMHKHVFVNPSTWDIWDTRDTWDARDPCKLMRAQEFYFAACFWKVNFSVVLDGEQVPGRYQQKNMDFPNCARQINFSFLKKNKNCKFEKTTSKTQGRVSNFQSEILKSYF